MVDKVVDASAVAALLFNELEAEIVATRIAGARLVAPVLLGFELANICVKKSRRQPDQKVALAAAFQLYSRFGIHQVVVEHAAVVDLAIATGLTAYDASYLWLARELGVELVTLDRKLAQAEGQGSALDPPKAEPLETN